jgi:ribosomal protein S18 acetylase RimI-like enzyme
MEPHILDNAAWAALSGPQASLAEVSGSARRFPVDVSHFCAIADQGDPKCWRDLAILVGPGGNAVLTGRELNVPIDWEELGGGTGKQMTGEEVVGKADAEAIELTVHDVPEMLDLILRTEPGPFLPRTIELGGYLGFHIDGHLVAMAGRRIHPQGWIEISAVCTDPEYRGRGLAGRLVNAVAAGIRADGAVPFLHVSESNENAIRLYETLGFRIRIQGKFKVLKAPQAY